MPNSPSTSAATPAAPSAGRLRGATVWRLGAAATVLLACGLAGWQGGTLGTACALVGALFMPWLLGGLVGSARETTTDPDLDPLLDTPRVSGGRVGAEVMVSQVVPVWSKQMDITREAAAEGMTKLLEGFSAMAGALGELVNHVESGGAVDAGGLDAALAEGSPAQAALAALLAPSERAFTQRDAAVAQLVNCSTALTDLRQLGRQAREVGKHTRLVAFNASIEANRGSGSHDGGHQAVANETRMLAGRMAEVGEQIERVLSRLERELTPERLRGETADTTPEELQMELQVQARAALAALLAGLGSAMRSSGEAKAAAETLGRQIDETFVNFQFGDRLSQMLAIVGSDMQNFARWVSANPYATQTDAAEWLSNLEASYTMDEQRAQHHGNVHIDRGSEIEFF